MSSLSPFVAGLLDVSRHSPRQFRGNQPSATHQRKAAPHSSLTHAAQIQPALITGLGIHCRETPRRRNCHLSACTTTVFALFIYTELAHSVRKANHQTAPKPCKQKERTRQGRRPSKLKRSEEEAEVFVSFRPSCQPSIHAVCGYLSFWSNPNAQQLISSRLVFNPPTNRLSTPRLRCSRERVRADSVCFDIHCCCSFPPSSVLRRTSRLSKAGRRASLLVCSLVAHSSSGLFSV